MHKTPSNTRIKNTRQWTHRSYSVSASAAARAVNARVHRYKSSFHRRIPCTRLEAAETTFGYREDVQKTTKEKEKKKRKKGNPRILDKLMSL